MRPNGIARVARAVYEGEKCAGRGGYFQFEDTPDSVPWRRIISLSFSMEYGTIAGGCVGRRRFRKAAVFLEDVGFAAPVDFVAEESGGPESEAEKILEENQRPFAHGEGARKDQPGSRVGCGQAKDGSEDQRRPTGGHDGEQGERDGYRIREQLTGVTGGPRTASRSAPAETMLRVFREWLGADAVFDHVRR